MDESPWGDVPSQGQPSPDSSDPNGASNTQSKSSPSSKPAAPPPPSTSTSRGPRGPPRKVAAQPTKLEAVDDALDPLGPLGESASTPGLDEQGPPPPIKESSPLGTGAGAVTPAAAAAAAATPGADVAGISRLMGDVEISGDDDGASSRASARRLGMKTPPPVQPHTAFEAALAAEKVARGGAGGFGEGPSAGGAGTGAAATRPVFEITVGDPHKVGDLTSSHIEYQVRTKTTSKAYRQPEFAVSRRYRDFLWLYNSLHSNNPGVVVPPPPEKQAVGRFDTNFVESRRAALERMLNKTAAHPILQNDSDLKIFLESESFNLDVKHKENKEPDLGQSKGMFSSFGLGGGGKFVEHDEWFHERKIYLDALESQLKALLKAVDTVVTQRKGLSEAANDFSTSLHSLALVELSPALSGPLEGLSELQLRIKELYDRQAQQDVLTLGITIDEYIRLIGSIKTAFSQRQKAYHSWHAAEGELQKRKTAWEKLLRQGKSQQDRLTQAQADVADAEHKVHASRLLFEDMGRMMRNELERFEKEKVEDFKSGVETFLESAVEAQKELIELWETFLLQLDEDDVNPYYHAPATGTNPNSPLVGGGESNAPAQ